MRIATIRSRISRIFLARFDNKKAMRKVILVCAVAILAACSAEGAVPDSSSLDQSLRSRTFNGERAYRDVLAQIEFGPRVPGSQAHQITGEWIVDEMLAAGWEADFQTFEYGGYSLRNIIAWPGGTGNASTPLILGAHYDTRLRADNDERTPDEPVPGANDGASGVAVLLELARVLDTSSLESPVWIVFFDAEDNGRIEGWDWILGSRYFVDQLEVDLKAAVIVDMVGDKDLQLFYERNSDPVLRQSIWEVAAALGFEEFKAEEKYSILDDHTPFLQAGIPAVDIIDFDYPYFHTTQDLPDKVSAESLAIVGRTLEVWLEDGP
jgi:hypothetical protein